MALPNLIALVALSKVVVNLTKEHFNKKKEKETVTEETVED
jgi:Na+/alanine symporter